MLLFILAFSPLSKHTSGFGKKSVELNSNSVAPGECKLQKDNGRGQVVRPYSLVSSHILAN
jgi:hypothetical protein